MLRPPPSARPAAIPPTQRHGAGPFCASRAANSNANKALPAYAYMMNKPPEFGVPAYPGAPTHPGVVVPAVPPPPPEKEAEKAYQEIVKAKEEEAKKKPKVMFYDPNTGTMSTKDPNAPEGEQEEEVEENWVELKTAKGNAYFYNKETKERAWEKPVPKVEEPAAEEEAPAEEEAAVEEEELGPEWLEYKTDEAFYFWNTASDPPESTWGPPPKNIKLTAEEKERRKSLAYVWCAIQPKADDVFSPNGKDYYYNPFSKQATFDKPGETVYKPQPAWEERTSKTGQAYYFDRRYKRIAWKAPPDMDAQIYTEGRMEMRTLEVDPRPQPEPEDDPPTDVEDGTDDEAEELASEVGTLKAKLEAAVKNEDYEEAANIKESIKEKEQALQKRKELREAASQQRKDKADKLQALKEQLEDAVKREDYEEAARLKKLMAEDKPGQPQGNEDGRVAFKLKGAKAQPNATEEQAADDQEEEDEEEDEDEDEDAEMPPSIGSALVAVEKKVKREKLRAQVKERMKKVLATQEPEEPRGRKPERSPSEPATKAKKRDSSESRSRSRSAKKDKASEKARDRSRDRSKSRRRSGRRRSRSRSRDRRRRSRSRSRSRRR